MNTISGRNIDPDGIRFDSETYRFWYRGADITTDLTRAQMRSLVPYFDDSRANLFNHHTTGVYDNYVGAAGGSGTQEPLSESTLGHFVENIVTDPLGAPVESLGNQSNRFFANLGIQKILLFGVLIFAAWIFVKGGWFKK